MALDLKWLDSVLLAHVDKNPVDFRRVDEREIKRTRRGVQGALVTGSFDLAPPVTRNAFLAACLDATEHEAREHLIVGYGQVRGRTTHIAHIDHIVGAERRVDVPPHIRNQIIRHHRHRTDAEVVVFHNHPRTGEEDALLYIIKALLDDLPIASHGDRRMLQHYGLDAIGILRQLTGGGRVRFFLGESGYVSEFTLPPFLTTMAQLLNVPPARPAV